MVTPITEIEAREALRAAGSPAQDARYYSAERRDSGWFFAWRIQQGPPLMGTRAWVVADNGRVRMLGFRESGADGIATALTEV